MTYRTNDPRGVLPWRTGDLIFDANGDLFQRADEDQVAQGWPWGSAESRSGSVDEAHPRRPVTLLVRDGRPIGGVEVDDRAVEGSVVRSQLGQAEAVPHGRTGGSAVDA